MSRTGQAICLHAWRFFQAHFDWCRSVIIDTALILWAFRLTLDPIQPLNDTGFMNSEKTHRPCPIEFELRILEAELRRMMKSSPEVVSVDDIDLY
ncbi:hypothetical protein CY34DRAFT_804910 [Suillus luteus UH-Slu-Lm8-n1]|uniref:Uncharacterized protein n=1 Tax=Suillus luteus UH-Slu-Lm8-n1 TaxID=930992 RepID=A0A0D0BH31_9AGAM|nr:hypothetical protein CY34DRAFT_804910 [Suillus luteus UH-Slu-Lm8-n1]